MKKALGKILDFASPSNSLAEGGVELKTFISIPLLELSADKELPGDLFLCVNHKFVKFKNKNDLIDTESFNRLVSHQVRYVFIQEEDRKAYNLWAGKNIEHDAQQAKQNTTTENLPLVESVQEQRRAMMDIFVNSRNDHQIQEAIKAAKKLVAEFMKKPFAMNNIQSLQRYSKGTLDHSVNVAALSVFLAIRMGYTHRSILENVALGALFHDIGKILIESKAPLIEGSVSEEAKDHPRTAIALLNESMGKNQTPFPREVEMIIAQHHEYMDGSGYPEGLRGLAIYDLSRIVAIANTFDNLVTQSHCEALKERCAEAIDRLENEFSEKLDSKKLEKAVKILRYSLL